MCKFVAIHSLCLRNNTCSRRLCVFMETETYMNIGPVNSHGDEHVSCCKWRVLAESNVKTDGYHTRTVKKQAYTNFSHHYLGFRNTVLNCFGNTRNFLLMFFSCTSWRVSLHEFFNLSDAQLWSLRWLKRNLVLIMRNDLFAEAIWII